MSKYLDAMCDVPLESASELAKRARDREEQRRAREVLKKMAKPGGKLDKLLQQSEELDERLEDIGLL
jgi:hypothetical protein